MTRIDFNLGDRISVGAMTGIVVANAYRESDRVQDQVNYHLGIVWEEPSINRSVHSKIDWNPLPILRTKLADEQLSLEEKLTHWHPYIRRIGKDEQAKPQDR